MRYQKLGVNLKEEITAAMQRRVVEKRVEKRVEKGELILALIMNDKIPSLICLACMFFLPCLKCLTNYQMK